MDYPIRINKYLAIKNICSRREADSLINLKKVRINGKIANLGDKIYENDEVCVDSASKKQLVYLAYNKPRGIVTHSAQKGEKEIADIFKYDKKIFPVGRLDKDSEGLIILTNDGRITNKVLSPDKEHEKEYMVRVDKTINSTFIHRMERGIKIDEGVITKKCQVTKIKDKIFSIILTEGKKRQIRRMCEALGYHVENLKRIRIMNVKLNELQPGCYRKIGGSELKEFFSDIMI